MPNINSKNDPLCSTPSYVCPVTPDGKLVSTSLCIRIIDKNSLHSIATPPAKFVLVNPANYALISQQLLGMPGGHPVTEGLLSFTFAIFGEKDIHPSVRSYNDREIVDVPTSRAFNQQWEGGYKEKIFINLADNVEVYLKPNDGRTRFDEEIESKLQGNSNIVVL